MSGQHEKFDVESSKRIKLIRQERIDLSEFDSYLELKSKKYKIDNLSSFGVAIRTGADEFLSPAINGQIVFNDVELGNYDLKVIRVEKQLDSNLIALEVMHSSVDINSIIAIKKALEINNVIEKRIEQIIEIPQDFKIIVAEVRDILDGLKCDLDRLEIELRSNGNRFADDQSDIIAKVVGRNLNARFQKYYSRAHTALSDSEESIIKNSIQYFRSTIGSYLYSSPIADRIYNKPLGYAGDYEMMNIIYDSNVNGLTLFQRCIHYFFVIDPAAQAVRNRATYLFNKIGNLIKKKQKIKIISVASGPAKEIQMLLEKNVIAADTNIEIHLLDKDETALQSAQLAIKKIEKEKGIKLNINYHNLAIRNIISKGLPTDNFDLVYSAGLFDYFSDPVCILAASKLIEGAKSGGNLVIGNFDVSNPSRPIMEIVLDWKLIYRSERDLMRLYGHISGEVSIEKESLGINLFCNIQKK